MRKLLVAGFALAATIAIWGGSVVYAQDNSRAALAGLWEGTVSFGPSWPASMTFVDDAGTLKWKASFRGEASFQGDAEGAVTSFSPPKLELAGVFTSHAVANARGSGIKFTLSVDGDRMTGTAISEMNNLVWNVSLTKKP